MQDFNILLGKKVIVVDDEPDVLDTLEEILSMCEVDMAPDFETAKNMVAKKDYDIAVLDIMGVNGYELLEITKEKNIISVMLTAHALSPDNFAKSMKLGANAYLPKDKMVELDVFLTDVLSEKDGKGDRLGKWFDRLKGHFEKKFGDPAWIEKYKDSWL